MDNLSIPSSVISAIRRKACILLAGSHFTAEIMSSDLGTYAGGLEYQLAQELYHAGYFAEEPQKDQDFDLSSLAETYELLFGRKELLELVYTVLNSNKNLENSEFYKILINRFPIIATTNYDLFFERAAALQGKNPLTIRPSNQIDIPRPRNQSTIIKLRGDIEDLGHIVLTREDALKSSNNNRLWRQVKSLLSRKHVIIAGFRLIDSEFTDIYFNLIENNQIKAFVLAPFPPLASQNFNRWNLLRERFERSGIQFLPVAAKTFLNQLEISLKETHVIAHAAKSYDRLIERKVEQIRPSIRTAKELLRDYKSALSNQLNEVRLLTEGRTLPLSKVFSELNLLEEHHPSLTARWGIGVEGQPSQYNSHSRPIKENKLFADENFLIENPKSFQRILRATEISFEKGPVLVVGDPGSGKTTLLRYLTLQASKDRHRLPIYVQLRAVTRESIDKVWLSPPIGTRPSNSIAN